jgi:hypothetical protein
MDEREIEAVAVRIFNNGQWAMRSLQGTDDRALYDRAAEDIREGCRATAREYITALGRVRDARGDDERSALNQTCCSGCTEPVRDEEPLRFRSGVLWHEACLAARSPQAEGHGPVIVVNGEEVGRGEAGMLNALDRMVPPRSSQDEYHEVPCPRCDGKGREGGNTMPASRVCSLCHGTGKQVVRSPQDGDHEAALAQIIAPYTPSGWSNETRMADGRKCARDVLAHLSRVSPSRVGSVAVKDVEKLVEALRWIAELGPYSTKPRYIAEDALTEFSRSSTDRPEQPEPDVLGGQPPAEPETT